MKCATRERPVLGENLFRIIGSLKSICNVKDVPAKLDLALPHHC